MLTPLYIYLRRLNSRAEMPAQAHKNDAGYDVVATSVRRVGWLKYEYGTGLAIADCPPYVWLDFRARSSCHLRGMLLANGCGTIDPGYRGEIKAVFWKVPLVGKAYSVGERIGQIIFGRTTAVEIAESDDVTCTERGTGGFGSTGN